MVYKTMEKEWIFVSFLVCVKQYAKHLTNIFFICCFKQPKEICTTAPNLQGRKLETHKD